MTAILERRGFLIGLAGTGAVLALPGCATVPRYSLTEAIRRLLMIASQNAFAMLMQPGGFYDNQVARIGLPPQLGGSGAGSVLAVILQSATFRRRLQWEVNRAAERGAERAAPLVADAIRMMEPEDVAALIGGRPTAATDYLRGRMGPALLEAMVPGISEGLRVLDDDVVSQALAVATGIDFGGLVRDIGEKADNAIWASIGAEEAAIRADPRRTEDPLLIGVFGAARGR
jgi:hypothetical protein